MVASLRVSLYPHASLPLQYSDEDVDESTKKSKDPTSKAAAKDSGPPLEEGPILRHDHSYIRHWLYQYVNEHVKASARRIKIQLLSPCLYGTFSLDDKVRRVRACVCVHLCCVGACACVHACICIGICGGVIVIDD